MSLKAHNSDKARSNSRLVSQLVIISCEDIFFSRKHIQSRVYFSFYRLPYSATCIRSLTCTQSKLVY